MRAEDELRYMLLKSQNADGGWAFRSGQSWTEPTALALLYISGQRDSREACGAASDWLRKRQRGDGSWPVNDQVETSSWVTSLVLLALALQQTPLPICQMAANWLAQQVYPEPPLLQRAVSRIFAADQPHAQGSSPWFAGTAGWVIPTACSRLALASWHKRAPSDEVRRCVADSAAYLLSRRCADGGWNHGGSSFRSENATSYPETTGLALLALADTSEEVLSPALSLGSRMLENPQSVEGNSWLEMGLLANHRGVSANSISVNPKTNRDLALSLLALAAKRGDNRFLAKSA